MKLALGKLEEAENRQLEGLEAFKELLNQKTSTREKRQVEAKFNGFRQLRVDILVRKGKLIDALTSAELEKNRCLTHILEKWRENKVSPNYEAIQSLLAPNRAIIYWHLSPYALTTFVVKYDLTPQPPSLQRKGENLEDKIGIWSEVNPNLDELENWFKTWEQDYQDYRGKGKNKTAEARQSHPWREKMLDRLQHLKHILDITSLIDRLTGVTELILIPHRDLHRFPLDYLFGQKWTIYYSPSLQIALNLQQKQNNHPAMAPQDAKLLSVENPANDLSFAEIESAVINRFFSFFTPLDRTVTQSTLTHHLQQPYQIFHFTGHGFYSFYEPENSALILSHDEQLTAQEISHLNLNYYQLVYLAACETALTGNQSLEIEYVGLISAFLKAGTSAVISTLWTVEEVSSAWLTIRFYQLYLESIHPALALDRAKQWLQAITPNNLIPWLDNLAQQAVNSHVRDLIQDEIAKNSANIDPNIPLYTHPYYWAGFTLNSLCNSL